MTVQIPTYLKLHIGKERLCILNFSPTRKLIRMILLIIVQIVKGSSMMNLLKRTNWIICGKGGMTMITFKFKEIGENLGTRQLGAKVREQLLPLINANDKVVLDFEGVNVVSNSFADECLAKLLFSMAFEELKQRTTFTSVNDFARKNIAIAFRRRIAVMA